MNHGRLAVHLLRHAFTDFAWPNVERSASFPGGTMDVAFPAESAEYRASRNRLLEQEIELRRAMVAVAADRRQVPPGGVGLEDHVSLGQGPVGQPHPDPAST